MRITSVTFSILRIADESIGTPSSTRSGFSLTNILTKRITLHQMRLKPVIAFMLLSMLSFNSLLSVTGGFLLNMHHDFSFHLKPGDHAETESAQLLTDASADEHHHHELKVIAEMDPTVRGIDPWVKVQMPVLEVLAYLPNFVLGQPVSKMASGFVARPPPDILPQQIVSLRTQVLRL